MYRRLVLPPLAFLLSDTNRMEERGQDARWMHGISKVRLFERFPSCAFGWCAVTVLIVLTYSDEP